MATRAAAATATTPRRRAIANLRSFIAFSLSLVCPLVQLGTSGSGGEAPLQRRSARGQAVATARRLSSAERVDDPGRVGDVGPRSCRLVRQPPGRRHLGRDRGGTVSYVVDRRGGARLQLLLVASRSTTAIRRSSTERPTRRRRSPCPGRRRHVNPSTTPWPGSRYEEHGSGLFAAAAIDRGVEALVGFERQCCAAIATIAQSAHRASRPKARRAAAASTAGASGRRGNARPDDRVSSGCGARVGDRKTHQQRRGQPHSE